VPPFPPASRRSSAQVGPWLPHVPLVPRHGRGTVANRSDYTDLNRRTGDGRLDARRELRHASGLGALPHAPRRRSAGPLRLPWPTERRPRPGRPQPLPAKLRGRPGERPALGPRRGLDHAAAGRGLGHGIADPRPRRRSGVWLRRWLGGARRRVGWPPRARSRGSVALQPEAGGGRSGGTDRVRRGAAVGLRVATAGAHRLRAPARRHAPGRRQHQAPEGHERQRAGGGGSCSRPIRGDESRHAPCS
jgi:hypothetical protein